MKLRLLCLGLLLGGLVGCGISADVPDRSEGESRKREEKKSSVLAPSERESPNRTEEKSAVPAPKGLAKIELKSVKYDELCQVVRANQGKVVVVDLWASWCQPCKKEFVHLVELHNKYGQDDLAAVSVSVDVPEDAGKALTFLDGAKATFTNFRLDEDDSFAQEKLGFKGVPAVFVFDRDGKRVGKFNNNDPRKPFSYAKDVIPLVDKLLAKQ